MQLKNKIKLPAIINLNY